MAKYIFNILIAIDRLGSALLRSDPNETLSSVAYRKHRDGSKWGFMCPVINALFRNKNHCAHAYLSDRSPELPA